MAESDFLNESVKDKDESDLKASTPPAVASSSSSIKLRKSSNILSAIVRGSLRKKPKVVISDVSVHNLSCVSTSSVPAERPSKRNMRETLWNIVGRGTSMRTNKNVSDDGISSWFFYNVGEEKARLEHNLSTSQNQTVFYEQKCKSLEDDLKAIKRQMEELKSKNEQDKLTIAKLEETKLLRGFGTDHMAEEPQDEKAEIKLLRLRCAMLERENSELGKLKTENQMLERNLETGHHLVTSLQIERSKYLEEKNVFLTVICHLKRELTRTKRLKDDLMTVTEKASKLGMIAEFNKQQGDKLKEEIMHKEGEISRLRASVHKLNQAQIRSAEEKRSLCSELDEACRVKEQLSQVLDNEVRKSAELDRSKGDAVKSANSQVEKIEETQRKERATIRILLRDLKILAEEKEVLVKEKNDMGSELEEAKKKNREQEDIIENLKSALKHGQEGAAEMRKTCETLDALKDQLKTKLDQQILKYDNNVNQLGKLIDQLRQEKKEADNKIKLLVEKSQELQQSLEEEKGKNSRIENCAREHCAEKESLSKEIERLTNEADYLNKLMEKVVDDFKNSVKSSRDKEEMYKSELKESRAIINTYATELDNLYRIVAEQKKEAATLNSLKQDVVSMETELVVLKRAKRQLEEKLSDAEETHNKEIDAMRDHLNAVLKQTTKDCGCYKEHLSGLVRKSEALEFFGSKENVALTQELTQKRDQITFLERELIERESVISDTVKKMADLEARLASQQIQNSEITLQLHETRRKLETEECLCKQLRNTQQLLLAAVLQIKENRKIDPVDCVHLMHLIRGSLAGGTA
ncbi:rho-associated protein kinase 2-like isoform X2 [Cylas formicarius]|uniref:rho-associated protein kinase 2-like isoform X2 n=1 Tax=Cylas formicarius TaxID=197179 RepID=UPI002958B872|nr:rho-associated protein kinase 2-like isoform X2 [Cylas formicarius]